MPATVAPPSAQKKFSVEWMTKVQRLNLLAVGMAIWRHAGRSVDGLVHMKPSDFFSGDQASIRSALQRLMNAGLIDLAVKPGGFQIRVTLR
jgi:hypothetical protein